MLRDHRRDRGSPIMAALDDDIEGASLWGHLFAFNGVRTRRETQAH